MRSFFHRQSVQESAHGNTSSFHIENRLRLQPSRYLPIPLEQMTGLVDRADKHRREYIERMKKCFGPVWRLALYPPFPLKWIFKQLRLFLMRPTCHQKER